MTIFAGDIDCDPASRPQKCCSLLHGASSHGGSSLSQAKRSPTSTLRV